MMEKRELFRAQNVLLRQHDGSECRLTFQILEGELLGIHIPIVQNVLSVIASLIMGKLYPLQGRLFAREENLECSAINQDWLKVVCVRAESSLIEEMTVMDNLYLLRKRNNRGIFYRKRFLQQEAARQLGEYDIPFQPSQPVKSLSRTEKQILEIFKAFLHGAELIVLDQITWDAAPQRIIDKLLRLISRLKSEGITFVLISDRLNNLKSCADRIAFFDGKQMVSVTENSWENQHVISETFHALVGSLVSKKEYHITFLEKGERIRFDNPMLEELGLMRGEQVAVYDPDKIFLSYIRQKSHRQHLPLAGGYIVTNKTKWRKWKDRPRVVAADFDKYNMLFDSLTVVDNLLLGRSDGIGMLKWVGNKYRNMLRREFTDFFSDASPFDATEIRQLTAEQRFKLYLFKLYLTNPDIVFAMWYPKADPVLVTLMNQTIEKLVSNNKTVCAYSVDIFDRMDVADRYLLMSPKGTESFSSYADLVKQYMASRNTN